MTSGTRRALLVGVDRYPLLNADLPSCVADVRAMEAYLRSTEGFSIETLVDDEVSFNGVLTALARLCHDVRAADRIVFFYSGHGTTVLRRENIEECILLPDGATLPDDDLVAAFKSVPPGCALVLLDSCFSGGMDKLAPRAAVKRVSTLSTGLSSLTDLAAKSARYHSFGSARRFRKLGVVDTDEAGDATLNAMLITACQEREVAMASTPGSQGLSAFTYAIRRVVADSQQTTMSCRDLAAGATTALREIDVAQTPRLVEPAAPPGLGASSFPLLSFGNGIVDPAWSLAELIALAEASARAAANSFKTQFIRTPNTEPATRAEEMKQ